MGIQDWLRRLFGFGGRPGGASTVPRTGTDADVPAFAGGAQGARWLSLHQPGRTQRGRRRGETHHCADCGATLNDAVLTTWGSEDWQANPLVVDIWKCSGCQKMTTPAFLTPEQVHVLCRHGATAGQAGRLDEAEYFFRRVTASWTDYSVALMQLASVYLDRFQAESRGANRLDVLRRCEDIALRELLAASAGRPPVIPWVHLKLTRLLLSRSDLKQANHHLDRARTHPDLSEREREEIVALEGYIARRGDLYDRGSELISRHMVLMERPLSVDAEATRHLRAGVEMLEEFVALNPEHWQGRWLLGKGYQALAAPEDARRWFAESWALGPDNINVGREYGEALLVVGEFETAVSVLRETLALQPEDVGLMGNLALGLLFVGADEEAMTLMQHAQRLDPTDTINETLSALIEEVRTGQRPRPTRLLPGGMLE